MTFIIESIQPPACHNPPRGSSPILHESRVRRHRTYTAGPPFGQYYSPTAAQVASYDSSLSNIASSYRSFTEGSIGKLNGNIFGLTQATPGPTFPVIGSLVPEFFDPLQSPLYDSQTPEAIRCTLLLLEMSRVHELAHVIYMHRSIPQNILKLNLDQQIDAEPLFSATEPVVELGEAPEC
jgi:hypothetical protein